VEFIPRMQKMVQHMQIKKCDIYHINKIKYGNHMIFSIDAEEALIKFNISDRHGAACL
jgi:hypothetical protein